MAQQIKLSDIAFDAGTQIRAAISEAIVTDYAERMAEGVEFPPVVLFHDGSQCYMADGFHRAMAVRRNGGHLISAELINGTKVDALWFALGANKANGQRLSEADRRHAVLMAVKTFLNDKSQKQIAKHVGVSQGFVSLVISRNNVGRPERVPGADGNTYPSSAKASESIKQRATNMLQEGKTIADVRTNTGIGREAAYKIQRQVGKAGLDKSHKGIKERREQVRHMADGGHTSRQIAGALKITERAVWEIAKKEGITVHADRAMGKTARHDANRIVDQMALDAENLTSDVGLIDFNALDRNRLSSWLKTFSAARDNLGKFIRRLMKEQQRNGEAA